MASIEPTRWLKDASGKPLRDAKGRSEPPGMRTGSHGGAARTGSRARRSSPVGWTRSGT